MKQYRKMRNDLLDNVKTELIGPGSAGMVVDKEREVLSESPLQRYTVGILYPQKMTEKDIENIDFENSGVSTTAEDDDPYNIPINSANEYYPSSIGMSFYVSGINPSLNISINTARYKRSNIEDCKVKVEGINEEVQGKELFRKHLSYDEDLLSVKSNIDKNTRNKLLNLDDKNNYVSAIYELYGKLHFGWRRVPIKKNIKLESTDKGYTEIEVASNLVVAIIKRPDFSRNITLYTVSLLNKNEVKEEETQRNNEKSFFQVSFSVELSDKQNKSFVEYKNKEETFFEREEKSMELLYRHKKVYGVGHGCSVIWSSNKRENNIPNILSTAIIPKYEVPQLKFEIEELTGRARSILEMKKLSTLSELPKDKIIEDLHEFCNTYKRWINKQEEKINELPENLQDVAREHVSDCYDSLNRIKEGINLLAKDDLIFYTFQLANEAMLMQRVHSDLQSEKRSPEGEEIKWPDYSNTPPEQATWRPFQLAFILLSLKGIVNPESEDRDLVDLIWFPTGGGKTEAYLGISAFTIFYRRLKYSEQGKGTTILMRYTLRLLTTQQFQRAGTLICACELIRRENIGELGLTPISLGLWIGSTSTPNKIDDAFENLKKFRTKKHAKNTFQILSCPWCGTRMDKRKHLGYREGNNPKRLILFCPEETCDFNEELPLKVIDEDLYKTPPTLLFSTVDKFALMPWKKEISNFFASKENDSERSPDLIIQDELHLISGPLGTIVGLYETAIDALSSMNGDDPKIISSTATIRRAEEQCKSLYNREVKQFPSPGLNANDSFFAREASLEEKPGRLYTGIMSSGKTQTTTLIRLTASILQTVKELDYLKEIKDKYWTLVSYFNSLRELGKCSTLANDDIKDQIRRIKTRHNTTPRKILEPEELTSRRESEEIPDILEKMENTIDDDGVINMLLASNMISVGVDVDRLSLMTVTGQPKTTSEYIQSTSRIGRKYPGIIFTLFDGTRPRDRSHYEQFLSYHQSLYRYVEPTSVTPFSKPSRDRGLHAVLVSLMRHFVGWRKNNELEKFNINDNKFQQALDYIIDRVKSVEPRETSEVKEEINKLLNFLKSILEEDSLSYAYKRKSLLNTAGTEGDYWDTLWSMRNVDAESKAEVIDWDIKEVN